MQIMSNCKFKKDQIRKKQAYTKWEQLARYRTRTTINYKTTK